MFAIDYFCSMKNIFLFSFALLSFCNLNAQGCSDAGACSIGGLKNDSKADEYVSLNMQYAVGEQNTMFFSPQLEMVSKLAKNSGLQLKLPYIFTKGNLGSSNGLGDITAVFTHRYYDKKNWKLGVNLGCKIGVNDANKKHKSSLNDFTSRYALPMPYQTSLGTHDLLIGFDARYREKWIFGLAFQMPLVQFNKNGFDTVLFDANEIEKKQYYTSAHLFRRPDLVFRADRQFKFLQERMIFQAGLLPIYHLGHDRYTDTSGVSHALSGSKGLTLNFTSGFTYILKNNFSIIVRYGVPLIVRKVRPDGLTRHFVSALELRYSF